MDLHRDFAEFLQCMTSRRARFLVVGAHALAAHGRPRYTGDLDVLIDRTPANAERVLRALADFGFGSVALSAKELTIQGRVVQLGFPPVRIDVLTSISGVSFRRAWAGRMTLEIAGVPVAFLGREQFLAPAALYESARSAHDQWPPGSEW